MKDSVFKTVHTYFLERVLSVRSTCGSFMTALPYLFGVGDHRKEVTEQYPDPISSKTADDLPPRSRGLLFNDIDRCTGCRECELVCPTDCIKVEVERGTGIGKDWVSVFDIDFSRCVFCGLCVEVCHPASLVHTKQYESASFAVEEMVSSFGRGLITPAQKMKWAEMRRQNEVDEE